MTVLHLLCVDTRYILSAKVIFSMLSFLSGNFKIFTPKNVNTYNYSSMMKSKHCHELISLPKQYFDDNKSDATDDFSLSVIILTKKNSVNRS